MEALNENSFRELLDSKQYKILRQRLVESDPAHIADLLMSVSTGRTLFAFRLLPKDLAVDVFDYLDGTHQNRLLESFSDQAAKLLLEEMPPDDRAALFDEVPAVVARKLLQTLSPTQRQITVQLLGYEEGTAGREMNPFFVDLRSEMSVAQALGKVRQLAINRKTIYECYVMDSYRHLIGTVSLKDLVIASLDTLVSDIMKPDPRFVFTYADREEAARILRENDLLAIPVLDSEQRLVGVITHDDVADILEQEATEDIYRFGAVPGTERGYFTSRIFSVVRRRVIWLFLLILVNTLTVGIIGGQSELLSETLVLAAFIPLLIGAGGNAGSQSATVVIRGLVTGEIHPKKAYGIVIREAVIGVLMGLLMAMLVMVWAFILGRDIMVATAVSLTMVTVAVMATVTGAALPFLLRVVRLDPALLSAPLITTLMDVFGLMLYFLIARLILL